MRKHITTALLVITLIGFVWLGVANISSTNSKLKVRDIQLQSKESDLLQLENKFNLLNKELEKKNLDEKKVKELESQKVDLQKQLDKAQSDLQARAVRQTEEKEKLAVAAQNASGSAKVSAAIGCNTGNQYKDFIYSHESSCNPSAVNSIGCRGIGQACPGTKLPCDADFACQDAYFNNYAMTRYGNWEKAYQFWQQNHWW
jgi:hypothetical protein